MIPGPRAPTSRPNRKTTARSYSRRILSPLSTNATTTAIAPHMATHTLGIAASFQRLSGRARHTSSRSRQTPLSPCRRMCTICSGVNLLVRITLVLPLVGDRDRLFTRGTVREAPWFREAGQDHRGPRRSPGGARRARAPPRCGRAGGTPRRQPAAGVVAATCGPRSPRRPRPRDGAGALSGGARAGRSRLRDRASASPPGSACSWLRRGGAEAHGHASLTVVWSVTYSRWRSWRERSALPKATGLDRHAHAIRASLVRRLSGAAGLHASRSRRDGLAPAPRLRCDRRPDRGSLHSRPRGRIHLGRQHVGDRQSSAEDDGWSAGDLAHAVRTPILSVAANRALGGVSPLGRAPARLPSRQRSAACAQCEPRLARASPPRDPWIVDGGSRVRAPPGTRGIGRLDRGAQEHPVELLLSGRAARISSLRVSRAIDGTLRARLPGVRSGGAQQDGSLHAARGNPRPPLVEAGADRPPRRGTTGPLLPRGPRGRARDGVGRDASGGGAGCGVVAVPRRPLRPRRARTVVLRGQDSRSTPAHLRLPALADRCDRVVAVALPLGGGRRRRRALGAAGTGREGSAGGGTLLRDHPRTRARLRRRLSLPLLLRRRPLPVSRQPRPDRALRRRGDGRGPAAARPAPPSADRRRVRRAPGRARVGNVEPSARVR